ncbi:uncharacterized protein LOC130258359 isoform X2 [Oenanthe melanoleuca]|uniref:uncharacterized protein LOC130258359 isoform X2 n=1 Tax=Oenanthe melanoleuca TaxID=2939378 RepID=UPI0024C0F8CD|nr:uncharacterized protein LOC130258359 isoform X2 [Oenanthe melanoleuca]
MALALRLFLLLLLAVALPARAAQAAPWPARGADWYAGDVFTAPWLEDSLDAVEPPTGNTFPPPGLDAAYKPSSHPRGPPRGKTQAKVENKFMEPSEVLDQMLSDLERRRGMKGEALQKEAIPRGSSSSVLASAAGRQAVPGTVTGDWDHNMDYLEALAHNHFEFLEYAEAKAVAEGDSASQTISRTEPLGDGEDSASTSTHVPNSQKGIGSGVCQGTRCLLEFMAIVAGGELVFMLCCVGVWYCWKRKRSALEEKLKAGGWSRDLYSRRSHSSSSESDQFLFSPPTSVVL